MPGEIRRVGECAERVLVEHRLAVNEFKYYDASAGLAETPVYRAYSRVEGAYLNFGKAFLHLVDGSEIGKNPAYQLHIADAGRQFAFVEFRICAKAREEEQTCTEALLVESVNNKRLIFGINSRITVACLECHCLLAGRSHRGLLVAAGHDCVAAVHRGFEPFHRSCHNTGVILCFQRDAGACIRSMDCARQQQGCERDANLICMFHNE